MFFDVKNLAIGRWARLSRTFRTIYVDSSIVLMDLMGLPCGTATNLEYIRVISSSDLIT